MSRPRVLSVSGVDPCGGAGLVADARTIQVCGGAPAGVPTATTVQSRHGFVRARATPADELRAMLDAVAADGPLAAVKVGLVAAAETVAVLGDWLATVRGVPLVVDPVLSATAGGGPAGARSIAAALVEHLPRHAAVFTPNLDELDRLGGTVRLLAAGCAAVVVKGGHGAGATVVDRLVTTGGETALRRPRLVRGPVHGTGCAFASAFATALARGADLEGALRDAGARVQRWLGATPDGVLPVPLAVD